jgi:hypothetical protein
MSNMNIAHHLPPPPENPPPELSAVEGAYRRILEGVADVPFVVTCRHCPHGSHPQAPEDGALREKIRARALFTLSGILAAGAAVSCRVRHVNAPRRLRLRRAAHKPGPAFYTLRAGCAVSFDWDKLEEVVERVIRRVRSEELREMAEAVKLLAGYMREGLEKMFKVLEEHSRLLERHERRLEELARAVGELKVALGSLGRRWGRDLERTVLELYRHALEERGVEPGRVERFTYTDVDGRYYRPGARIEVDVYAHDDRVYLIEVKSRAELDDIEWFYTKAGIVERILGRRAERLILVAVDVDREAVERARQLGIDVICGSVVE